MSENITEKIIEILKDIGNENNMVGADVGFDLDADLFEMGLLDSFGMIEYLSKLEDCFQIKIGNEDLQPKHLSTINGAEKLIKSYLLS
jgi:acyl carrier protein